MKNKNNPAKSTAGVTGTGKNTTNSVNNNNSVQMRRNRSRRNGRKNSSGTDETTTTASTKTNSKTVFRKPRTSKQSFSSEKDDDEDEDSNTGITTNDSTTENDVKCDIVDDETQTSNQMENDVNGQETMSCTAAGNFDNSDVNDMPAKPGTMIKLHGVILHETTGGLIVLNVRWRNKIYSGALIDVEKTKWAGERIAKENNNLMIGLKPSTAAKSSHSKRTKRSWDDRDNDKVTINNNNNGSNIEATEFVNPSEVATGKDLRPTDDIKTEFITIKQEQSGHTNNDLLTPPNGIYQQATAMLQTEDISTSSHHLQHNYDDPIPNTSQSNIIHEKPTNYIDVMAQPKSPDSLSSNNDGSAATNSADGSVDIKIDVESNDPVVMPTPSIIVQDCTVDENDDAINRQDSTRMSLEQAMPLTTEQLSQFQHPDYFRCSSLMPRYMADIAQLTPNLKVLDAQQNNQVISSVLGSSGKDKSKTECDSSNIAISSLPPEMTSWQTTMTSKEKKFDSVNERLVADEDLIQASDDENSEVPATLPGLTKIGLAMERNSFEKWKEKMETLFPDSAGVDPERRVKVSLLLNSDEESNEEDRLLLVKLRQRAAEQHNLSVDVKAQNETDNSTEVGTTIAEAEVPVPPENEANPKTDNAATDKLKTNLPTSDKQKEKQLANKKSYENETPTPTLTLDSKIKPVHKNSTGSPTKTSPDLNVVRETPSLPPQLVPDVKLPGSEPRAVPFLQPNISAGRPISRLINKPESITGSTSFRVTTQNNTVDDREQTPAVSNASSQSPETSNDTKKTVASVDFTKLKQSVAASVDARLTTTIITERTGSRPMPTSTITSSSRLSPDPNSMERTLIGAKTWVPQEVYSQGKVKLLGELPYNDASRKRRSPVLSNERNENIPAQWKIKAGNPLENSPQQNQYRLIDGRPYPTSMHSFTTEPIGFTPVPALSSHGVKSKQNITVSSTRMSQHPVPIAPAPLPASERSKPERELPPPVTMDHDGPQMSRFTFTHDKKLVPSPMENRGRPRKVRVAVTQQIPVGKPQDVEISRCQPMPREDLSSMRKQPVTPTGSSSVRTSVIHGRGRIDGGKPHEELPHVSPVRGISPHDANTSEGDNYYVKDKRMKLDIVDKAKHFHKPMADMPRGERVLHPMKNVPSSEDHRNARSPAAPRSPNDLVKRQASPSLMQGLSKSPGDIRNTHSPMHGQWNRGGHPFVNPMVQPQIGYAQGAVPFSSYFVGHPYQQGGASRASPHPSAKEQPSPPLASEIKDLHNQHELIAKQKQNKQDMKLPPTEFFAYDPKYPPQAHIEALRNIGGNIATSSPSNFAQNYQRRGEHPPNTTGDLRVYDRTPDRSPSRSTSDLAQHQIRHARGAAGPYHPPSATSTGSNHMSRMEQRPDMGPMGRPPETEIARRVHLPPGGQHLPPGPAQGIPYHEKAPFMTSQGQRGPGLLSNNLIFSRADGHYVGPVNYDQRQLDKKR